MPSPSAVPTLGELLNLTEGLPTRRLADGEFLVEEGGSAGQRMFILVSGTLLVVKGDVPVTPITEAGSVIGETSVLLGRDHSATVKAVGEVEVRVVDEPLDFLRTHPDLALGVSRLLAKRLSTVTSYLADVKSQFADRADHLGLVDEILDALVHDQSADAEAGSVRDPDPAY